MTHGRSPGYPVSILSLVGLLFWACAGHAPAASDASSQQSDAASELASTSQDAMPGAANAEVTVTAFVDLNGATSLEVVRWWTELEPSFESHVRWVFVPIATPHQPESVEKTASAIAEQHRAGPTGFAEHLRHLVSAPGESADEKPILDNTTRLLTTPFVREQLMQNQRLADKLGILATPAIYLNGRGLPSVEGKPGLEAQIRSEGQRARAQKLPYPQTIQNNYTPDLVTTLLHAQASAEPAPVEAGAFKAIEAASPVPILDSDPTWGDTDAPVTLVEFSDFECPFCARVLPTLELLRKQYGPRKLRIVWKDNPLPFHKMARPAARAGKIVHSLRGDFWAFHDQVVEHQRELSPERFADWAEQAGVNRTVFARLYARERYDDLIEDSMRLARASNLPGTPGFLINGIRLTGAQPIERFQEHIDAELAAAELAVKAGVPRSVISALRTKENYVAKTDEEMKSPRVAPADTKRYPVPVLADDPVIGKREASVTIVQWSDFQCPFCNRVEPTLLLLREHYGDDLRIVWKDNPLPFHKRAGPAARLARYAYKQKGNAAFWKLHGLLFENQRDLSDENLLALGKQVGLSAWGIKQAIREEATDAKIQANVRLASDLQARGTPHFFINGRRLAGAQPKEKFVEMIDAALAEAQTLRDRGVSKRDIYDTLLKAAEPLPAPEQRSAPAVTTAMPSLGPKNAKVTIQAFLDFECPYCKRVQPTLKQLLKNHPNDVRVVFRHMPLAFHKQAPLAAEAALEAFAQGGTTAFWRFHDHLFSNQGALTRENLEAYASELGLDLSRFQAALDDHRHAPTVQADIEAAKKAGVSGTPAFLINDFWLSGAQPIEEFERRIELSRGK